MADAKTSQRFEDAIALIEIGYPFEVVEAFKGLAQNFKVTTLVAKIGTGAKLHAAGIAGSDERGRTIAARHERWKREHFDTIKKRRDKNDSEIARILLKKIAKDNHPDDETGCIPKFDRMRRLVAKWRRASE